MLRSETLTSCSHFLGQVLVKNFVSGGVPRGHPFIISVEIFSFFGVWRAMAFKVLDYPKLGMALEMDGIYRRPTFEGHI